jgi:hypothetical protein
MHLSPEARSKAQQINIEYNRKDDAFKSGVSATQTLINSAQTKNKQSQECGVGLTAFTQKFRKKEKMRKKNLRMKTTILKQLSQRLLIN